MSKEKQPKEKTQLAESAPPQEKTVSEVKSEKVNPVPPAEETPTGTPGPTDSSQSQNMPDPKANLKAERDRVAVAENRRAMQAVQAQQTQGVGNGPREFIIVVRSHTSSVGRAMFWKKPGEGYTSKLSEANLFDRVNAQAIEQSDPSCNNVMISTLAIKDLKIENDTLTVEQLSKLLAKS